MTRRPRATDFVCAVLLLLAALAARLPGINGDLWLDEAWVANSILAPTWRKMFFYEPWMQTTPPLHLIVTRLLVAVLGDANWVFRLLALIFGVASVLLAVRLARRIYSPFMGWLAGGLIALSNSAAMFSKEGKSYSGELCLALLLMLLVVELPAWWIATSAMLLAFGFSYSSIVFFPGVVLAYLLAGRLRAPQMAGMVAGLVVPVALAYWFYIRPNQSEDLKEMWRYAFPQDDALGFYWRTTRNVFAMHHWPPLMTVSLLRQLVLLLALAGILKAVWQVWRERDFRLILTSLLPLACTILLNAFGLYPYDAERFSIYLFGGVVLLLVTGVDWVLPKQIPAMAWISVALTVAVALAGAQGHWPRRVEVGLTEAREELVRQRAGEGDLLFIAPQQWEGYLLAQRRNKLPVEAMEGRATPACCPRDGRWQAATYSTDVEPEMNQLIARGTGRRIWLLHQKLMLVNVESQRIPETWHRAYLVTKGCREEFAREYQSTVLSAYRCPLL